jgi:hypothetical protein
MMSTFEEGSRVLYPLGLGFPIPSSHPQSEDILPEDYKIHHWLVVAAWGPGEVEVLRKRALRTISNSTLFL